MLIERPHFILHSFAVSNVDLEKVLCLVPAPKGEKITLGLDIYIEREIDILPLVFSHYQNMRINGALNGV